MLINKGKKSFRPQKAQSAIVIANGGRDTKICDDLTLSFQAHSEYIKYILEDQSDQCFPFMVEGKWHMNFSEDEEMEELVDSTLAQGIENMTETEKKDLSTDKDELVDALKNEVDNLTED